MKGSVAKSVMTVKYWVEGEPKLVQAVTAIRWDSKTGEFIIDTIFDEIRIPYKKFETVLEVS
jgi:hypothetical protein